MTRSALKKLRRRKSYVHQRNIGQPFSCKSRRIADGTYKPKKNGLHP